MPSEDLDYLKRAAKVYEAGKRPKFPRVGGLLRHVSAPNAQDISNVSTAIFVLLAYGACHVAAWNTHLPSPVERLLSRISSVVISVVPAYALFLLALHNSGRRLLVLRIESGLRGILGKVYRYMFLIPVICIISLAVLSGRLYLFVQSFLSLGNRSQGAFESTPWEGYWPHL